MATDLIIGFLTLTALEIVLGIDNLIFISILAGKLPKEQQAKARNLGIALALIMRLALLGSIAWIMSLTATLFSVGPLDFSGQSLILLVGGFFLIGKATYEIHENLEGEENRSGSKVTAAFGVVVTQIVLLDAVFSLDSIITAVGMIDPEGGGIWVMVAAVVIAVIVMLVSAGPLSRFVNDHPSVKVLALAFLLLIGVTLVADGLGFGIDKAVIYSAMGFSLFVELLNLAFARRRRKNREDAAASAPVKLHSRYSEQAADVAPGSAPAGSAAAGTTPAPEGTDRPDTA